MEVYSRAESVGVRNRLDLARQALPRVIIISNMIITILIMTSMNIIVKISIHDIIGYIIIIHNVGPCLMMGGPPPEQLPFLFNTAAPPKFAAQLQSYRPLESI